MKIKNNNILKQIGSDYIIIPIDDTTSDLDKIFKLNTVGLDIYNFLQNDHSFNEIIDYLYNIYTVDKEILINDVKKYLLILNNKGLLDV